MFLLGTLNFINEKFWFKSVICFFWKVMTAEMFSFSFWSIILSHEEVEGQWR